MLDAAVVTKGDRGCRRNRTWKFLPRAVLERIVRDRAALFFRNPVDMGGEVAVGPDGMLKPDVAWVSELRMIGGVVGRGEQLSDGADILSRRTYLREPTPDLVKALMVSAGERNEHDARLGWGTSLSRHPWNCEPRSVTLAWRAKLQPGANNYRNGIPIPLGLSEWQALWTRKPDRDPAPAGLTLRRRELLASRLQTSLRQACDHAVCDATGAAIALAARLRKARRFTQPPCEVQVHSHEGKLYYLTAHAKGR